MKKLEKVMKYKFGCIIFESDNELDLPSEPLNEEHVSAFTSKQVTNIINSMVEELQNDIPTKTIFIFEEDLSEIELNDDIFITFEDPDESCVLIFPKVSVSSVETVKEVSSEAPSIDADAIKISLTKSVLDILPSIPKELEFISTEAVEAKDISDSQVVISKAFTEIYENVTSAEPSFFV